MRVTVSLACALLAASPALAVQYTFTALPTGFNAVALNNVGQIAGNLVVPGAALDSSPAIYADGVVTPLSFAVPATDAALLSGINDAGDLTGAFAEAPRLRFGSPFTVFGGIVGTPASPAVVTPAGTQASGLSNQRQVVGSGVNGQAEGYVSSGSTYAAVIVPGLATYTQARGINNAGAVVGTFGPGPGLPYEQGFLDQDGTFTTIAEPGSTGTFPVGINDGGEIVGSYAPPGAVGRGFTDIGGVFSDITGPDGAAFLPVGVNNAGQLVGTFGGSGLSYLATPQAASTAVPEPGTAALFGGVAALGLAVRRRNPKRPTTEVVP